jgi:hypothetical protein
VIFLKSAQTAEVLKGAKGAINAGARLMKFSSVIFAMNYFCNFADAEHKAVLCTGNCVRTAFAIQPDSI